MRRNRPDSFEAFHRALFEAHWAGKLAIDDLDVLVALGEQAGVAGDDVATAAGRRLAKDDVDRSTDAAQSLGVSGTPAFFLDGRFVLPGAQPYEVFDRMIERLRARPRQE